MSLFKFLKKRGNIKGVAPVKDEPRQKLLLLLGLDCSGSMGEAVTVVNERGETVCIPKITQLNQGYAKVLNSIDRFEKENTRFSVQIQVIPLDTYCKPLFPTYISSAEAKKSIGEVEFKAGGSTNIEAWENSAAGCVSQKHTGPHYNRPINIILMSDGVPTDVDGYALSEAQWKDKVDRFKAYLDDNDFSRNVSFYFIAVGDEAEPFGRYFVGGNDDHFFMVSDSESLADKLDFVTRQSLADSSTIPTDAIDFSTEDENEDDLDVDEDEETIDEDEETIDEDEDDSEEDYDDSDETDDGDDDFDDEDESDDDGDDSDDEDDIDSDEEEEDSDADNDTDDDADNDSGDSDDDDDDDDGDDGDGDDGDGDGSLDDILDF